MPSNRGFYRTFAFRLAMVAAVPIALIYGRYLTLGFLGDDFLYLSWAKEGIVRLIRMVSLDSTSPKMIRPLAVMPWMIGSVPGGAIILHALSLALHGLNAFLIGCIVRRRAAVDFGDSRSNGPAYGTALLFAAFPLFCEPVLWLSAGFDLWSTCFALLCIFSLTGDPIRARVLAASGLFMLAILSKESALVLPLLIPLLLPWRNIRRSLIALCAIGGFYLLARLALFHGIGGYQTSSGELIILSSSWMDVARVFLLQIPYRILMPVKFAGPLGPWLMAASIALIAGMAWSARWPARPLSPLRIAGVFFLACLPVMSMIRIEYDHLGARLIYFPVAMGLIALGGQLGKIRRAGLIIIATLAVLWGFSGIWNARSWGEAGEERDRTLAGMTRTAPFYPAGSTLLLDARRTLRGAYVFNNGLDEAARLFGLSGDHRWVQGSAAELDESTRQRLGRDVFELSLDPDGRPLDWTDCARRPPLPPSDPILHWDLPGDGTHSGQDIRRLVLRPDDITIAAGTHWVTMELSESVAKEHSGRIYWRWDRQFPFLAGDSQAFRLTPGQTASRIRLMASSAAAPFVQLRIDFNPPLEAARLRKISLSTNPQECGPRRLH